MKMTHDQARRRKATRSGRRTGCYIYIPWDDLERAGFQPGEPAPFYRIWAAKGRPRFVVNLYREA